MQTFKGHKKEATSKDKFYCHQGMEYFCYGVTNVLDHPHDRWYFLIATALRGPWITRCFQLKRDRGYNIHRVATAQGKQGI